MAELRALRVALEALDARVEVRGLIDARGDRLIRCLHCGAEGPRPWGQTRTGLKRFRCAACRRTFSSATGTVVARLRLVDRFAAAVAVGGDAGLVPGARRAARGRPDDGNKGRVCHRWWRRGDRPPGVQQLGYLWAARHCPRTNGGQRLAFTAIRPATGEDVTLVLPAVNTAAMQVFLDHVAAYRPADAHLVMVLDGAGWHVSRDLAVPPCITLVVLPPYGPELNPVERVWLYLRERFLSLRLLHSTDAIIDACCDAWMRLVAEPDRIKSLCSYPWIEKVAS